MPTPPTGTVTLLFSDIEGSTRLLQQLGERYPAILAAHQQLLRSAFQACNGYEVDTQGDSFFVTFARAADAVAAAVAAQQALAAHPWPAGGAVRVRMGLHTGAPTAVGATYVGLDVHRAARVGAAGHGGQVLLSQATAGLVRHELVEGVSLRDLGAHRLKDLSRPEQIFQLVTPDLSAEFPPLRTLDPRRTNLPAQPTPLIGRKREIVEVTTLLRRDDVRLLTLTGSGGTGKTRLALQAAAELADAYVDGVWFVDLAPISDPPLVGVAIAQALGVPEIAGQPRVESLKAFLRPRQVLLLLDNLEQVVEAAPLLAELLMAALRLTVLATSRVALRLSGEHEYPVPPLALPGPEALPPLAQLTQYDAVRLFIERAQAVQPSFQVTSANAPAVAEICVHLDGLPLAIELAAAWVKLFPPEMLQARLERAGGLGVLIGGPRDLPTRQQTIRGTIEWSYKLLDAAEQALFRRLGVFVGGWTLEAAEAVGAERDSADGSTLYLLKTLVDHSLVIASETAGGEPRYTMLETLREYALERLRAAGEEIDLRRRHAAFFAAWVEAIQPNVIDLDTSEQIGGQLGNFRAALDWSLARGDEDALYGLRLFGSLWELWFTRYPIEGSAIAERALACASARDQDLVAARIYNAAARLYKNPWASTRSIELLERSLALARQYEDRPLQAEVLRHLGDATYNRDLQAAEAFFEESLRICRELDDAEQEGWTMFNLGQVAGLRGDLDDAERCYQRSLALFVRLGYPIAQAWVLHQLSMLVEKRGDHAAADSYLARAFAFSDRFGGGADFSPLIERGWLACQRGDYQRALDLLQQGYDQAQHRDNRDVWVALMWQAVCHVELGDLVTATQLCRQALAIALENVDDIRVSQIAMIIANVAVAGGKHITVARLLGCADSYLASISYQFEHDTETDWKRLHDRTLTACRAALDEATFAAAWEAGQALTLEQAIAEALGNDESGAERPQTDHPTKRT
jgi:predicted ATPase/class 3 adenylate cyclase